MKRFLLQATFCLIALLPIKVAASEGDWLVTKATAQVSFTTDRKNWLPVKTGMVIPNGAWMSTGPRGRALLQRGVESVSFHPETMASIITTNSGRRQTEVLQPTGTLDLEIEKRAAPHTRVDTPYMAAVVKGTIFRVTVSKRTAAVAVSRGLVNVQAFQSGQQADVGPGQSASVSAGAGMHTRGINSAPAISRAPTTTGLLGVPTAPALAGVAATAQADDGDLAGASSSATSSGPAGASGHSAKGGKGAEGGKGGKDSKGGGESKGEGKGKGSEGKGSSGNSGGNGAGGGEGKGKGDSKGSGGKGGSGDNGGGEGKGKGGDSKGGGKGKNK